MEVQAVLDLLTKQTEAIQLMANNLSQSKPETSANISWPSPLNIEGLQWLQISTILLKIGTFITKPVI